MTIGENIKVLRTSKSMDRRYFSDILSADALKAVEHNAAQPTDAQLTGIAGMLGTIASCLEDPEYIRNVSRQDAYLTEASQTYGTCWPLDEHKALAAISTFQTVHFPDVFDPAKTAYVPPMPAGSEKRRQAANQYLKVLAVFHHRLGLDNAKNQPLPELLKSYEFDHALTAAALMIDVRFYNHPMMNKLRAIAGLYTAYMATGADCRKSLLADIELDIRERMKETA